MNIRKKIFYMTLLCIACWFVISCKKHDDSGNLIYGFAYNYIQMDSPDPTVCLVFNDCAYDAYLLDETVDLSSYTFDSSFLERKDLLSLDDWQDLPPEIIYDAVYVDSNLVFCRFKQEYQKNKFVLKYDNIRTDVGKWGDATDDRDYLSGYYTYSLSTTYSEQERKKIMESVKYPPQDSIWNILYEHVLFPYFQRRLELERDTCTNNITATEKLRLFVDDVASEISYAYYKSRHPGIPRQNLPLNNALKHCEKIAISDPLLYLPFPLGSSAYIFDRSNIEEFEEDTFYCGMQNFYATYYELPISPENLCRIISYDSNGILAEMLPEVNEQFYLLTLFPETGQVARAHLSNSESYLSMLRRQRLSLPSAEWNKARAADTTSNVLTDYDPQIFINAFPLVEAYAKAMKK